jgi:ankyrin repeat protein
MNSLINDLKRDGHVYTKHLLTGDVNALRKLIEHGANIWLKDRYLLFPMHYAICSSHYEMLQLILSYKIPDSVVSCIMETFSDYFVKSSLVSKDLRVQKLLVDKFFHRIKSQHEIRNIVRILSSKRECVRYTYKSTQWV